MHKPIFILVDANNAEQAKQNAEQFINNKLIGDSFDWYQGLKKSKRWNKEFEIFDTPKDASTKQSMLFITKMIKSSQAQIMEWLTEGKKELDERKLNDLGDTLCSFSIASGHTQGHIFDSTNWSCGSAIVDFESLKGFWENKPHSKIFICGFDIHY